MKALFKKTTAMLLAIGTMLSVTTYAEGPQTAEELEALTSTKKYPYFTRYHLASEENLDNNYKGGEGFQITMAYAICEVNEKLMLRGDDTSGVHTSNDGGKTWEMSATMLDGPVTGLAFYPESENICFASVEGVPLKAGMYKSLDAGKTWERKQFIYNSGKHTTHTKIGFGKKDEETGIYPIYNMSTGWEHKSYPYDSEMYKTRGLYKSTDIGETWELIAFENDPILGMWCDIESDTVIVCTRDRGISVSYDGGMTWEDKNNGWEKIGATAVAVDPYDKNHWIAVATNVNPVSDAYPDGNPFSYQRYLRYTNGERPDKNHFNIMYESTDGGENWTHLTSEYVDGGIGNSSNIWIIAFSYQKDPETQNTLLYMSLEESVYPPRYSADYGRTFHHSNEDLANSSEPNSTGWYQSIYCFTPNTIMRFARGGVQIYDEEEQKFKVSNSGISGGLAMTYDFDKNGDLRYIGLMDVGVVQIGKATGTTKYSWYDGDYPVSRICENYAWGAGGRSCDMIAVDPNNEKHCFGIAGAAPYGQNSAIVESFDGFMTTYVYQGIYDLFDEERAANTRYRNSTFIKYNPTNPNIVYSSWFTSFDNGKHWQENPYQIMASGNQDGDICYSVEGGKKLFMSTDCGKTWKDTGFSFGGLHTGSKLAVDVADDYVVWAGNHGGCKVYRVDIRNGEMKTFGPENGISDPNAQIPTDLQMSRPVQDPKDPDHLIVYGRDFYGSGGDQFETYDGGETWTRLSLEGGSSIAFSPVKKIAYFGGASGTWIYDYEMKAKLDKDYFLDIDESPYKEEIKAVAKEGIIEYDIDGNYYPTNKITRALMAKTIVKAKQEKLVSSTRHFADVSGTHENYAYIAYACDKGYMTVDGDNFNPDNAVTFDELAGYIKTIIGAETDDAYTYCVNNGIFKAEFEKTAEPTNEETAYALFKALGLSYIK